MSTVPLVLDEHLAVSLPPPGPSVVLGDRAAILDFVFTLQPSADALVALCDDHRHVLLVVTTRPDGLDRVPVVAGALDPVTTAVVVTAHPGTGWSTDAAGAALTRLDLRFGEVGVRLLDWIRIDDRRVRSVRGLATPDGGHRGRGRMGGDSDPGGT